MSNRQAATIDQLRSCTATKTLQGSVELCRQAQDPVRLSRFHTVQGRACPRYGFARQGEGVIDTANDPELLPVDKRLILHHFTMMGGRW